MHIQCNIAEDKSTELTANIQNIPVQNRRLWREVTHAYSSRKTNQIDTPVERERAREREREREREQWNNK